jgi:hypothetical protein
MRTERRHDRARCVCIVKARRDDAMNRSIARRAAGKKNFPPTGRSGDARTKIRVERRESVQVIRGARPFADA